MLEEVIGARCAGPVPVFVSLWEWPVQPRPAVQRLVERGAAVLGLNCQARRRRPRWLLPRSSRKSPAFPCS